MIKKLIAPILALLIISSCKKPQDILLNMSDYPVKVGDQWIYQQTFHDFPKVDTTIITITAKTIYNNDSTVFQTHTTNDGITVDSGIIIMTASEYKYVPTDDYYALFDYTQLTFPVKTNSVWTGEDIYDTLRVVAFNQKITVLGNTYNNVIEIIRAQDGQQYFTSKDTLYICAQIGIIEVGEHVYTTPTKTVKLIGYQLH
jgi:hypothetical protein